MRDTIAHAEPCVGHVGRAFGDRRDAFPFRWPSGATVEEIVQYAIGQARIPKALWPQLGVQIEGQEAPRARWPFVRPKPDKHVLVYLRLAGGDQGKAAMAALGTLAISLAAPYLLPAAFAATTAGKVVAAGISVVGAALVNGIFVPRAPREQTASRSYFITGTRNTANPYGPVWQVLGRHRIAMPYAAVPHAIPQSDRTLLLLLFDCGFGEVDVTDIRIGEQRVADLPDVEVVVHQGYKAGDPLSLYTRDVEAVQLSLNLPQDLSSVQATTAPDTRRLAVDLLFPEGLFYANNNGSNSKENQGVVIDFRETGAGGSWQSAAAFFRSSSFPGARARADGVIEFEGKELGAFAATLNFVMPEAKRYDLRFRITNQTDNSEKQFGQVNVIGLRTIKSGKPIRPETPRTIVEMAILGSEKLSSQIEEITAICTSRLMRCENAGQIVRTRAPSRNPADAFLEVLIGPGNPRPIRESRIDVATIADWRDFCRRIDAQTGHPRHYCDAVIRDPSTLWDTLVAVASTGRATPILSDGKISVAWDDGSRLQPVQVFTPRNVESFSASKPFLDLPHAIRVRFVNPDLDWQEDEVVVYMDGYSADGAGSTKEATRFEDLPLWGVTRAEQAWREGRYMLAQARLRPETYTIGVSLDHLVCNRGSRVRIAFDEALIGGVPARVADVTTSPQNDTVVTLDMPVAVEAGWSMLHRSAGGRQGVYKILRASSAERVTLAGRVGLEQGDLVVLGEAQTIVRDCYVQAIEPAGDMKATLRLVDWAPEIYQHESEPIPPYDAGIVSPDPGRPGKAERLAASTRIVYVGRFPYGEVTLTWGVGDGPMPNGYVVWQLVEGRWEQLLTTQERRAVLTRDWALWERSEDGQRYRPGGFAGQTLTFRVQAIGLSGARAPLSEAPEVSIVLRRDRTPPADVARLIASIRTRTVFLEWLGVTSPDLIGYQIRYSANVVAEWHQMTPIAATQTHDSRQIEVPGRNGVYAIKALDTSGNRSRVEARAIVQTTWLEDYNVVRLLEYGEDHAGWTPATVDMSEVEAVALGPYAGLGLAGTTEADDLVSLGWTPASEGAAITPPAGYVRASISDPVTPPPLFVSADVTPIDAAAARIFVGQGVAEFPDIVDLGFYHDAVRIVATIEADGVNVFGDGVNDDRDLWDARVEVSTADRIPTLETWLRLDDGAGMISIDYDKDGTADASMAALYDPKAAAWSDWTPIHVADVEGRVFRFRLVLTSSSPKTTPVVRNVVISVDVPDRMEHGRVSVGASPVDVTFKRRFAERPSIGISAGGLDGTDRVNVTNETESGFRLTLVHGGTGSTSNVAAVQWIARGWGRIR